MKKLPYREGDLFTLPLRDSGIAIGLIARAGPRGQVLFGYFFNLRYDNLPDLVDFSRLTPGDAIVRYRFGDLGLINGRWQILGAMPRWDRIHWPMPPFVREDPLTGHKAQVIYAEDDPSLELSCIKLTDTMMTDPKDGVAGCGYIELWLTQLLAVP